jgi:multidrug resistance efflux pump
MLPRFAWYSLLLSSVLLLGACAGGGAAPTPTPDFTAEFEQPMVIADGRVLPTRHAELRFTQPGTVAMIMVTEGEQVAAGAPLARLDTAELEVAVAQARAALDEALAQYELLQAGASDEVVSAAAAQVAQAEAAAQQTAGRVTPAELQAARDELREAQAVLARLSAGPRTTERTQAEAALSQAQSALQSQRDALSAAKHDAELRMTQAANMLRDAQDAYSRIYWENEEFQRQSSEDLPQARKDAEAAALRAVASSEAALDQARLAFEQARLAEQNGIAAAEAQVREAQARRDQLLAGAEADQIAGARARVSAAQARLAQLSGTARAGELAAAEAGIAQAEANLAEVSASPQPAAAAAAEARVRVAQANLRQAELALSKATLNAPFAGTVVKLNMEVGVEPAATEPTVVLADLSAWKIETSDLTELDVVNIREGDPVQISFDALPELNLTGVVSAIEELGRTYQGDVIYTVTVTPQSWDARLRWNMTATVTLVQQGL